MYNYVFLYHYMITLDQNRQGSTSNFFRLPQNLKSCIACNPSVKMSLPFQWFGQVKRKTGKN